MKPYSFILVTENLANKDINQYFSFLLECSKHGISAIQIRNKTLPFNPYLVLKIKKLAKNALKNNVHVFINDNYKIANTLPYKNVHLGQNDASPFLARSTLGAKSLIGLSVNNLAEINKANSLNYLSYVGVSAIYKTNSKQTEHVWGLEGLKEAKKQSKHKLVAIGGITEANAEIVLKNGADGLAIISDIHKSQNPYKKIKNISQIIKQTK